MDRSVRVPLHSRAHAAHDSIAECGLRNEAKIMSSIIASVVGRRPLIVSLLLRPTEAAGEGLQDGRRTVSGARCNGPRVSSGRGQIWPISCGGLLIRLIVGSSFVLIPVLPKVRAAPASIGTNNPRISLTWRMWPNLFALAK